MDDQAIENLLRRRRESAQPAGGPLCGDAELLAAYAEGSLDDGARDQLQAHLAACGSCREAVVTLVRIAPREAVAAPARSGWKIGLWAIPALAALAVAAMVWKAPHAQPLPIVAEKRAAPEMPAVVAPEPAAAPASHAASDAAPAKPAARRQGNPALQQEMKMAVAAAPPPPPPPMPAPQIAAAAGVVALPATGEKQRAAAQSVAADQAVNGPMNGRIAVYPYAQQNAQQSNQAIHSTQESVAVESQVVQPPPASHALLAKAAQGPFRRVKDGVLAYSTDAGKTWIAVKTPEPVESFKFTDEKNGEIICKSKRVYRTKDGGATWEEVKP